MLYQQNITQCKHNVT